MIITEEMVGIIVSIIILIVAFILYFLPSLVAIYYKRGYFIGVFLLNLFCGWIAGIGWAIALIWAIYPPRKNEASP